MAYFQHIAVIDPAFMHQNLNENWEVGREDYERRASARWPGAAHVALLRGSPWRRRGRFDYQPGHGHKTHVVCVTKATLHQQASITPRQHHHQRLTNRPFFPPSMQFLSLKPSNLPVLTLSPTPSHFFTHPSNPTLPPGYWLSRETSTTCSIKWSMCNKFPSLPFPHSIQLSASHLLGNSLKTFWLGGLWLSCSEMGPRLFQQIDRLTTDDPVGCSTFK